MHYRTGLKLLDATRLITKTPMRAVKKLILTAESFCDYENSWDPCDEGLFVRL